MKRETEVAIMSQMLKKGNLKTTKNIENNYSRFEMKKVQKLNWILVRKIVKSTIRVNN